MNENNQRLIKLYQHYKGDVKGILRDLPELEYLYALSDMRESLLEWFPFSSDGCLLQVGSDYGALTGLFARRVSRVVVLDYEDEDFLFSKTRHKESGNIEYVKGSLLQYQAGKAVVSGAAEQQAKPQEFDYVVMAGTLRRPYGENIEAAKLLLKPGGMLIVAVCNSNGIKYWAGTKRESDSFSRKRLSRLLGSGSPEGKIRWYYPMPDYRLAYTIYSHEYLPKKGDLAHTIVAYDYPEYLSVDVGARFDEVCEDEAFEEYANSFLAIWSADERN